jgi:hypothetical protein
MPQDSLPITHKLLTSLLNVGNKRASLSGTPCSPALGVIFFGTMEFDVKAFLKHHSPEIFEIISETRVDWRKLGENYKERYERLLAQHETEGVAIYQASIYEILMYASDGRQDALYVQTYFKETIKRLKTILSDQELKFIADNITGVVTNLDMTYLNFIGELGFLVIIKTQTKWILTGTEIKNEVQKRIDFEFKTENDRQIKVEIMNIHLTKEINEDNDGINKFLTKRIGDKKTEKTKKNLSKVDFLIAPVIWGPHAELRKISNHLKRTPWTIPMTLKPIAFMNFKDTNTGEMFQKFKDLETIFD